MVTDVASTCKSDSPQKGEPWPILLPENRDGNARVLPKPSVRWFVMLNPPHDLNILKTWRIRKIIPGSFGDQVSRITYYNEIPPWLS